jgi:dTDP-L-rhamnose 4-epimerase
MDNSKSRVLITGGAGFIGSRLAARLLADGCSVRVLDNMTAQVHGPDAVLPRPLSDHCDVRIGDVRDADAVRSALQGVDVVCHLAAETGPAQSQYEIARYAQSNQQGTAVLLEEMLAVRDRISRLVVASSRAIYGEGQYLCADHGPVFPDARPDERLRQGRWEPICPICANDVTATATPEDALPKPTSIYAVTKLSQEHMCLVWGRAYGIPTCALRYQNVYGPGQSLTNPYIGVLAIFSARIRSGSPLYIYEDGRESRDFVHIDDVVRATADALLAPYSGCGAYNVGCGTPASLLDTATLLAQAMERSAKIEVNANYRVGDIRHCWADMRRIKADLGFEPRVGLHEGLADLAAWAMKEDVFTDDLDRATRELAKAGLYREGRA